MPTRNVDLIDELDRFVRAKVDSGRYEGNHLQYFFTLGERSQLSGGPDLRLLRILARQRALDRSR